MPRLNLKCAFVGGCRPPWALLLWGSGHAGVVEILLGVGTKHLALVTTDRAFYNNFRFDSGNRWCVYIGWVHVSSLLSSEAAAT
jgi:hypothetical protein